jgi:group I intron endonuclease
MRKEKKYHFIYKTTNLINNRYYIGLHSTDNLDDEYLGSGTYLNRAIKKYGKPNFKREILEFHKSRKDVIIREKELVTLLEVQDANCMNMVRGGQSVEIITHTDETRRKISETTKGKSYVERYGEEKARELIELRQQRQKEIWNHRSIHEKDIISKKMSNTGKGKPKLQKDTKCPHCGRVGKIGVMSRWHFDNCSIFTGTSHKLSAEHIHKLKDNGVHTKNSIWINNNIKNKRIYKADLDEYVINNWKIGMIQKN